MNETTKYLLNRIAQLTAQYEAQTMQLMAALDEKDKELRVLRAPIPVEENKANVPS